MNDFDITKYVFPTIVCPIVLLLLTRSLFIDWKQHRDRITFFHKKAFIISFVFVFLPLFIGLLLDSGDLDVVIIPLLAIGCASISTIPYIILWSILDDPKQPDGNAAFETYAYHVLTNRLSGTRYIKAKYEMEQYMAKHGIVNVRIEGGLGDMYLTFESPEAKARYFKNGSKFQSLAEDERQNKLKDDWLL